MANVQAPPILCNKIGKLATTKKLKAKLDTVQILIAIPLIFKGNTSETKIQPIGPKLIAKQIMYVIKLPTASHFKFSPKTSANAKEPLNANKLNITPVSPKYKSGFLFRFLKLYLGRTYILCLLS